MSWMTPLRAPPGGGRQAGRHRTSRHGEHVLDPVVVTLDPDQADARGRPRCRGSGRARAPSSPPAASTAIMVPRGAQRHAPRRPGSSAHRGPGRPRRRSPRPAESRCGRGSRWSRRPGAAGPPSRTTTWSLTRSSSPSRWEVTTTAIPKSSPDPADQSQHVVAGGRVQAVGRLVQQHQGGVVDQRLGELGALLHARWSSRPWAGSAPRPARRAAARRRSARARRCAAARTSAPGGRRSRWR